MNQPAIGSYFPTRDQQPLSDREASVVREFHELYYQRWTTGSGDTKNLSWFGYHLIKTPLDLWIYQELLVRTRPDIVIQTGTLNGGSALFLAMIQDHLGHGRVVSIDIEERPNRPTHPRLAYITGSSVDQAVVAYVSKQVGAGRAMVILNSDHRAGHVYDELMVYSPLVQLGDYLIVEDTNLNGHPVYADFGPGPMEAVVKFLAEHELFLYRQGLRKILDDAQPKRIPSAMQTVAV